MSNASINSSALHQLYTCNANEAQWMPWALRGSYFKLLNADEKNGRFVLLLKFEAGVTTPVHRHIGAVEAYVLEGGFHYIENPEQRFTTGCYLFEDAGSLHQPVSPEGTVMLAVFHGPVEGINRYGESAGAIDCRWHIDTWNSGTGTSGKA
jgi:anti-sigma factor ChrR (cupin superfamily)